jgi:hypothetical protein
MRFIFPEDLEYRQIEAGPPAESPWCPSEHSIHLAKDFASATVHCFAGFYAEVPFPVG